MNVPKYMIEKIKKANGLITEGNKLILDIQEYFREKGATEETVNEIADVLDYPDNENEIDRLIDLLKGE